MQHATVETGEGDEKTIMSYKKKWRVRNEKLNKKANEVYYSMFVEPFESSMISHCLCLQKKKKQMKKDKQAMSGTPAFSRKFDIK